MVNALTDSSQFLTLIQTNFIRVEQAIRYLHDELRRLKASGIKSLYVDNHSLEALSAARHKLNPQSSKNPHSLKPPPQQELQQQNASNAAVKPLAPQRTKSIQIKLPDGTVAEKLDWVEQQYRTYFKGIQPEPILFGSGGQQAEILICRYQAETPQTKSSSNTHSKQNALLSKVFQAMELAEQSIYSTHLIKRCPSEDPVDANASAQKTSAQEHLSYLWAQIECIQPKVLLILGKACYDAVLDSTHDVSFAQNRGQWRNWHHLPVMTSYDPNYLLQNDTLETKRQFWEDMLKILVKLGHPISNKQSNYFLPRSSG
jgi:DNA polymerase